MFKFIRSFVLLSLASLVLSEKAIDLPEKEIDCEALASEDKCLSDTSFMTENCLLECKRWQEDKIQFRHFEIDDDSKDALYELVLTNSTGHSMNFEHFEGYVTVILPFAKICFGSKVGEEVVLDSIESLKKTFPYGVEIIVFAFEHPSMDYTAAYCNDFDSLYATPRSIYMMELATLNGPNADPIFKLIRKIMNVEELDINTTQYYVLSPDFTSLEFHYGKSIVDMKDILNQLIKELEPTAEL